MARGIRLAVVACVLIAVFGPPSGADPVADRDRVRQQRAAAAAKLQAAEATDQQLADAADVLTAAERAASGKAQAAATARQRAEADVAEAQGRLGRQRHAVVERAVRAYAEQGHVSVLVGVKRPEDAARRLALAEVVQGRLVDAVDSSRAALDDLHRRQAALAAASKAADRALRQASAASAQADKAKADLDARITEFRQEVDALDAEQSGLDQLLAARASRAAVAPPDPPSVAGGSGAAGGPVAGISSSGFIWPLNGRLTSPFGQRWGRLHAGQDIADPVGTPIHAAKAGVVIKAGPAGGYGNFILVDHGGGVVTGYAHQSRFAVGEGAQVQQGEVIGYVGSTGHSTGPHLHFEVRVNGAPRDPRPYLP